MASSNHSNSTNTSSSSSSRPWRIHLHRLGRSQSEAEELGCLLQEVSPHITVEGGWEQQQQQLQQQKQQQQEGNAAADTDGGARLNLVKRLHQRQAASLPLLTHLSLPPSLADVHAAQAAAASAVTKQSGAGNMSSPFGGGGGDGRCCECCCIRPGGVTSLRDRLRKAQPLSIGEGVGVSVNVYGLHCRTCLQIAWCGPVVST
jgi:hypothetical protein